ncbi:hypothetical protein [Sphingomonas faeni]|uniref:hypothetical protein n=1 Tax=Sphingomonas faeni TaxID=185950 RepID=UPI003354E944
MPVFLITLLARSGIPARFTKALAWLLFALIVVGLCWAAVAVFRGWVADGKEEAVRVDRSDVTIEAANLVINATSAATANQMARDDAFQNAQEELQHEADTKSDASSVGPGVQSVLDRMREQQAAGRRGPNAAR